MSSRGSILVLILIPLLSVAATCSGPEPIDVDDTDRFTPSGRASYEILPGNDQRRSGALLELVTGKSEASAESGVDEKTEASPKTVQFTLSIDGEMTGFDARDEIEVQPGDQVRLGASIPGPVRVQIDADNLHGQISGRTGVRFADMVSLEGILGLGIDHTEIQIRGGGVEDGAGDIRPGFLFGGRLTFRPIPLVDFYAQSTLNIIKLDDDDTYTEEHQVGVDFNLTRNLSIFSGYRWWEFNEDKMNSGSDVDLEIEGPTAGVSLKF